MSKKKSIIAVIVALAVGIALGAAVSTGLTTSDITTGTVVRDGKVEYKVGRIISSDAMLRSSTVTFTYDGVDYIAYNGYIGACAGTNWTDANTFVNELNAAKVDGCTSWQLLKMEDYYGSNGMAEAWHAASGSPKSFDSEMSSRGMVVGIEFLHTDTANYSFDLADDQMAYSDQNSAVATTALANIVDSFVVIRPAR